jgi:alpha-L-fucosidase
MLLNIGPRPDGRIAAPDEDLLSELGLWMMLYGEAIKGVRPWTVTNEGEVWLTSRRGEDTVYAFADLEYGLPDIKASAGCRLTLRSVRTTPETRISVLSQNGGVEWVEDTRGLHITVSRTHTIQLIKNPLAGAGSKPGQKISPLTWGPDWPVALKMTNIKPA